MAAKNDSISEIAARHARCGCLEVFAGSDDPVHEMAWEAHRDRGMLLAEIEHLLCAEERTADLARLLIQAYGWLSSAAMKAAQLSERDGVKSLLDRIDEALKQMPKCDCCGRFHACEPGSAWMIVYSGVPLQPDREITRCLRCVEKYGGFAPQPGIRPEHSCGIVK